MESDDLSRRSLLQAIRFGTVGPRSADDDDSGAGVPRRWIHCATREARRS